MASPTTVGMQRLRTDKREEKSVWFYSKQNVQIFSLSNCSSKSLVVICKLYHIYAVGSGFFNHLGKSKLV